MSSSNAAHSTVVIHVRETKFRETKVSESEVDNKHQSRAARSTVPKQATMVILEARMNRARNEQTNVRDEAQANTLRRAQIEQQWEELNRVEPALTLRNRRVYRLAVASWILGLCGLAVGIPVGLTQRSSTAIGSAVVFGITTFLSGRIAMERVHVSENDIAYRRATLVFQREALAAQERQTQRDLKRANTAVENCEQALTEPMRAFVMDQLKQHTTISKDPASIVADYVGINEDELWG